MFPLMKFNTLIHWLTVMPAMMVLSACSETSNSGDNRDNADGQVRAETARQFDAMLDQYYEANLKLNPVQATFEGDNRFNHEYFNDLSESGEQQLAQHYAHYQAKLAKFRDRDLNEAQP